MARNRTPVPAAAFTSAPAAHRAILAGKATITLVSRKTGERYTYEIVQAEQKRPEDRPAYFVSYLTGPNNAADYRYLGMLVQKGGAWTMIATRKSALPLDSTPSKAINWTIATLQTREEIPAALEVWHEGRCCRCGRKLTVPESISSALGPECATRV